MLSTAQIQTVLSHISRTRYPERNRVIFLLTFRAGLRAKEVARLTWSMILDPEGTLGHEIRLLDSASKGGEWRCYPDGKGLAERLVGVGCPLLPLIPAMTVIQTSRAGSTSPQVIVNVFQDWYRALGFEGCSSHSGRRTFITRAARNIGRFGGSLRDVQALARHSSLAMTQRYIEVDAEAMRKVVDV